jgi:hypothetical protein
METCFGDNYGLGATTKEYVVRVYFACYAEDMQFGEIIAEPIGRWFNVEKIRQKSLMIRYSTLMVSPTTYLENSIPYWDSTTNRWPSNRK